MFNIFAYDTDIDKNKKKCMPKGKEEMTMEMKSIKAAFANVFSPAHLKKIAAAAVDESELSMWEIKLKTRDHDKRYRNDGQTFSPVYKVECHAGTMEYELRIDAVTGDVLSYEAEVDDDRF